MAYILINGAKHDLTKKKGMRASEKVNMKKNVYLIYSGYALSPTSTISLASLQACH